MAIVVSLAVLVLRPVPLPMVAASESQVGKDASCLGLCCLQLLVGDEGFERGHVLASVLGSELRDPMLGMHRLYRVAMRFKPLFHRLPMNAELRFEQTAGDTPLVR